MYLPQPYLPMFPVGYVTLDFSGAAAPVAAELSLGSFLVAPQFSRLTFTVQPQFSQTLLIDRP